MELSLAGKLLMVTLVISSFNTGLIWIVQVVHYPGFLRIPEQAYVAYQQFHMKSISFIVAPSMVLELLASLAGLAFMELNKSYLIWISLILLLVIWLVTFFAAVPLHNSLAGQYDAEKIQKLVDVNWARTVCWTVRTVLLGAFMMLSS